MGTNSGEEKPKTVLRMKGTRKVLHHLFKSDVQPMKKNVSYKKGAPRIETLEHTHIFHSVNSQLKPQQYCSTVGGHFHMITWGTDENGQPVVTKVGPPLSHKYVKKPSGQKRVTSQVEWRDDEHDGTVTDHHSHKFEYIHSEELSEEQIRAVQHDTAQVLSSRMHQSGLEDHSGGDAA